MRCQEAKLQAESNRSASELPDSSPTHRKATISTTTTARRIAAPTRDVDAKEIKWN
jgi:hypothetical protein